MEPKSKYETGSLAKPNPNRLTDRCNLYFAKVPHLQCVLDQKMAHRFGPVHGLDWYRQSGLKRKADLLDRTAVRISQVGPLPCLGAAVIQMAGMIQTGR